MDHTDPVGAPYSLTSTSLTPVLSSSVAEASEISTPLTSDHHDSSQFGEMSGPSQDPVILQAPIEPIHRATLSPPTHTSLPQRPPRLSKDIIHLSSLRAPDETLILSVGISEYPALNNLSAFVDTGADVSLVRQSRFERFLDSVPMNPQVHTLKVWEKSHSQF